MDALNALSSSDALVGDLSLVDLVGRPAVLAFVERWTAADCDAHLAAIRAHLRSLGAVLLVFAPEGVWYFHAEAGVEKIGDVSQLLAEVDQRCGKRPTERPPFVHVLDATGAPCCRLDDTQALPPVRVVAALAEAERNLAAQTPRQPHRGQRVVNHLVAGFAIAFAAGCLPTTIHG